MIRWALLLLVLAAPVWAEEGASFDGTLLAIHTHGVMRIGYRESAPPFSSRGRDLIPVGFSIELCREVAADVAEALHLDLLEPGSPDWRTGLRVNYIPVSAEARLPMVIEGQIDIECGATTANAERAKTVAFSPVFFLAGTKLLVPARSPVRSVADLAGRTVAAGIGTTNADVMRRVLPPTARLVTPDIEGAYRLVAEGGADAMASDDVLLAGLVIAHRDVDRLRIAGDYLSYEPYALTFRRDDPAFAALVRASFARIAASDRLQRLYDQWIGRPLALPIGPHLAEIYRALSEP